MPQKSDISLQILSLADVTENIFCNVIPHNTAKMNELWTKKTNTEEIFYNFDPCLQRLGGIKHKEYLSIARPRYDVSFMLLYF